MDDGRLMGTRVPLKGLTKNSRDNECLQSYEVLHDVTAPSPMSFVCRSSVVSLPQFPLSLRSRTHTEHEAGEAEKKI